MKRSAPFLALEPKRSRIGVVLLYAISALALFSVSISGLQSLSKFLFIALAALITWRALHFANQVLVVRASLQSDGTWLLATATGEQIAELYSASLLAGMIGIRWRIPDSGAKISLMLWPDSLPRETHRQLRVWLRAPVSHASKRAQPENRPVDF